MEARILRRHRRIVYKLKWCAVCAVGLTESIIFQVETAVIIERRAPQHGTVIHHAVIDIANDFAVTEPACFRRHAEIARIHELDELGRFVIEPDV